MQKTLEATIRLSTGQEKVTVQASSQTNAKQLIEKQCGKGCIIVGFRPT